MQVPPRNIEGFIKKPPAEALAILIYGPDEGLVRDRLSALTKQVVADVSDPFNIAEFDAARLKETPSLLLDEAQAISMLGGRRVVRLRDADDGVTQIVKGALAGLRAGDNLVLVTAGDLPKRSTLRDLFERAENAAAIPCYVEDARDIGRVLADTLKAAGYGLSSEALVYMAANVVGDRGVAVSEAEKLITYMGAEKNVTLEDVMASTGNAAALSLDDLARHTFSGQMAEAERVLAFALSEGETAVGILRRLQSHVTRLILTKARLAKGEHLETAMKRLRPPVFWKMKSAFESQVGRWPLAKLMAAQNLLTAAEARCKQTGYDPALILSRAVVTLSSMSASGRKRA